jgi:hypothetical protein
VPELAGEVVVPPPIAGTITRLEASGITKFTTYEQNFAEIDNRLSGTVKTGLLLDEKGRVTVSNAEAEWVQTEHGCELKVRNNDKTLHRSSDGKTCIDGILVCGVPGRSWAMKDMALGHYGNRIRLGKDDFVLDIRGDIKPTLSPSRCPPERNLFREDGSWRRIQEMADKAHGRLWEKIIAAMPGVENAETIWQLLALHGVQPAKMRAGAIWGGLLFPVLEGTQSPQWQLMREMGPVYAGQQYREKPLTLLDGWTVGGYEALTRWKDSDKEVRFTLLLQNVMLAMGTMNLAKGEPVLEYRVPDNPEDVPWQRILIRNPFTWIFCLPYSGSLKKALSVEGVVQSANNSHPLVQLTMENRFVDDESELQAFARAVVNCLSDRETFALLADPAYVVKAGDRWRKSIGHFYRALDWDRIDPCYRPPYPIWLQQRGMIEVTGDDFEKWAKA